VEVDSAVSWISDVLSVSLKNIQERIEQKIPHEHENEITAEVMLKLKDNILLANWCYQELCNVLGGKVPSLYSV